MKIKIKVKNLIKLSILTLFIILIVLPYATLEIAKYLDRKGSDKALAFYESYLNKPVKLQNDEALYNYALNLAGETDKYTIMMMGWGGGAGTTLDGLEKASLALEKILNNSSSEGAFYSRAYSKIMDICINLQEPKELMNWIEWGKKNTDEEINYISDLYRAFYHYANRDYDLANKALEGYDITDEVVDNRYYTIQGEIALFKGDFETAIRNFELSTSFNTSYTDSLFGSRSYIGRNYWYNEYESSLKGNYKVRGRVEFNGEPMPFVEVYIQDNTGFRTGGNDHIAITDINGEYETLGIRSGTYQIGIGLSNSLLYDKVYLRQNLRSLNLNSDLVFDYSFNSPIKVISPKPGTVIKDKKFIVEWDNVSGADYYTVEITTINNNATFRTPIIDNDGDYRIRETIAEFDIDKSRNNIGGLSFDGEEMLLLPMGVLGNILPGEEHPIIVNAYDENDNLIGSSLPLNSLYEDISSIVVEGYLTQGEKLINESKYEEAIKYYEEQLQKDPNDKEALVYLSKIYMIGWKKGEQNFDKAIEYSTRYKELTNDYNLSLKAIGFMDHDARINNRTFIENLFDEIPVNERKQDYYYELGRFYTSLSEFEKSRTAYMEYVSNGTYIPDALLYLNLYLGDFDGALSILSDYKYSTIRMNKNILNNSILNLKADNIDATDYEIFKVFLEKILRGIERTEGNELYHSTYTKLSNPDLKNILHEIRLEMYWDRDY
jgi:tetratricopeptide (TPR) repeat protein